MLDLLLPADVNVEMFCRDWMHYRPHYSEDPVILSLHSEYAKGSYSTDADDLVKNLGFSHECIVRRTVTNNSAVHDLKQHRNKFVFFRFVTESSLSSTDQRIGIDGANIRKRNREIINEQEVVSEWIYAKFLGEISQDVLRFFSFRHMDVIAVKAVKFDVVVLGYRHDACLNPVPNYNRIVSRLREISDDVSRENMIVLEMTQGPMYIDADLLAPLSTDAKIAVFQILLLRNKNVRLFAKGVVDVSVRRNDRVASLYPRVAFYFRHTGDGNVHVDINRAIEKSNVDLATIEELKRVFYPGNDSDARANIVKRLYDVLKEIEEVCDILQPVSSSAKDVLSWIKEKVEIEHLSDTSKNVSREISRFLAVRFVDNTI